jgi:hypothetical protein
MKKFLSVVAAVAATAAALVGLAAGPVAALDAPIADYGTSVVSRPGSVSPPGALVLYQATYSNSNVVDITASVTDTLAGGGSIVSATFVDGSSCAVASNSQSAGCTVAVPALGAVTLNVRVQTPATTLPTSISLTSAIASADPLALDLTTTNDSATATTAVAPSTTTAQSSGYVPEGGTLTWRKHVLTVRQSANGVVASLSDTVSPSSISCGGTPCGSGLHAEFDQDTYFDGLMAIDLDFGQTDPCHGVGADKCHALFVYKPDPLDTSKTAYPIPSCDSTDSVRPCLESFYKSAVNEFHFVVVLDTHDPDLVTTAQSLTNVRG